MANQILELVDDENNSSCNQCNGKPHRGIAIINIHNIQTQDKSKEFVTKLIDCNKCTSCGHSWVPSLN